MTNKNTKIISKFALVVMMVAMSACSSLNTSLKPNGRIFAEAPEGAPENYKQGWVDGCESGMAIVGNQMYKSSYQNKIDQDLIDDEQYYRGWNEAKTYCAHYTMATQWEAGTLPQTPSEETTLLPEMPKGVFAVAASWGAPSLVEWSDVEPEEEGEGFAGFYRN